MIETEQTVRVDRPIGGVWDYVRDIERWAQLMPGLQRCTVIDADDSRWTLKVGAGALVRTVNVLVHVERWEQPERVTFSYTLEGDPVRGGGTYQATALGADETEVALKVRVEGTGPMAPMWEAIGRPLLPQFAKGFAEQLKAAIEDTVAAPASAPPPPAAAPAGKRTLVRAIAARLRSLLRVLFGSRAG